MSVGIIVINITEERRTILQKQFTELNIPFKVHFMEATTPTTAISYLPKGCTEKNAKIICCARSHCRAIELAGIPQALSLIHI